MNVMTFARTVLMVGLCTIIGAGCASGHISLHFAVSAGDYRAVADEIRTGADVNETSLGTTPMIGAIIAVPSFPQVPLAAVRGHAEVVQLLIDHGANVNGVDEPLHFAVRFGRTEIAKLLIDHGADIHAVDDDGEMPLHTAVLHGRAEIAKLLVKHGADVHAKNDAGETPLHIAALDGNTAIAKLLIENGADANIAIKYGNDMFVAILQKAGVIKPTGVKQ